MAGTDDVQVKFDVPATLRKWPSKDTNLVLRAVSTYLRVDGTLDESYARSWRSLNQIPASPRLPRHHDDPDRRPTFMQGVRKSQTVDAARQLNVGAHERDVGSGFQECDGFVGIQGFNWRLAGVFHHVDRAHAEHYLVLDDANDGWDA